MRDNFDRPRESSGHLQRAALVHEHALNKIMAEVSMHRSIRPTDVSATENNFDQLPTEHVFDAKTSEAVQRFLDSRNLMELLDAETQEV